MDKRILRKIMLKQLKAQKEGERLKKSEIISRKVLALKEFKKAKTVLLYVSFNGEVETRSMIKEALKRGKLVCLPYLIGKTKRLFVRAIPALKGVLVKGPYGILQPSREHSRSVSRKILDFVLVPGLAFTKSGLRLGRGAGYYDRFLAGLPKYTLTVGVCFSFQLFPSLARASYDLPVRRVISA